MKIGFFHFDPVRFCDGARRPIASSSAHDVSGRVVVAAAPDLWGLGSVAGAAASTAFTAREHPPTNW